MKGRETYRTKERWTKKGERAIERQNEHDIDNRQIGTKERQTHRHTQCYIIADR